MDLPAIEIIPDWRQLIIQLISLFFLLFMFKRYAWQPTKAFLDKRRAFVEGQFNEAEVMKEKALDLKQTYETRLMQVEEEAERLIEASKDQGKAAYDEILVAAREEAKQKLAKAEVAIAQDRKVAHEKIKAELVDISVSGARQLIKKEIDADVHQHLFDEFLAKVGDMNEGT